MSTIPGDNPITDRVRFWLYIAGAVLTALAPYLVDRDLIGAPEDDLIGRVVGLLTLLAAANTATAKRAAHRAASVVKRTPPTPPPAEPPAH